MSFHALPSRTLLLPVIHIIDLIINKISRNLNPSVQPQIKDLHNAQMLLLRSAPVNTPHWGNFISTIVETPPTQKPQIRLRVKEGPLSQRGRRSVYPYSSGTGVSHVPVSCGSGGG